MVVCSGCQSQVADSSRFCPVCGTAQLSDNMTTRPATRSVLTPRGSSTGEEGRFLPGTLLADRYRIAGLIGRGGMGEVYKATDLTLGQAVALKFLPENVAADQEALARFLNEVRIARQVSHPNVCRVYDVGVIEGLHFLSMEYIDGEDLGALLRRIGRLPDDKAVEIARRLCAGLAAAHDKGVLHRDLKPSNIMIDARGQVLITDFGLAALATQIQGSEIRSGTPAYMAPEQLTGKEVTVRSDVYSLGLVLYEMFTGRRAFDASTLAELVRMREHTTPASPGSLVRDLDPAVERVILRCLDADPRNRPPSALAVSAALPGGDPLAAALAAGETPTPEMVAAAGVAEGMRPSAALACVAGIVIGTLAAAWVAQRTDVLKHVQVEYSPDALAQRGRDLTRSFGYTDPAVDTAWNIDYSFEYLRYLRSLGEPVRRQMLSRDRPPVIDFWYRQSPRFLSPEDFFSQGKVRKFSPRMTLSGMTVISFDQAGRMTGFSAVPPQVEDPRQALAAFDWNKMLTAAGFDPGSLKSVEARWAPLAGFDSRAAWTTTLPGMEGELRIEAASWRGRPVNFQMIWPWTRPTRMEPPPQTGTQKASQIIFVLLLIVIVGGAALIARYNLRQGRGDRRGASRLGSFVFLAVVATWAVEASHVAHFFEVLLIMQAIAFGLFLAALTWLLYVALEPYVRRRWPQTLIGWSRLLSGRLRDPLVGHDVLIGCLFGVVYTFVVQARNWAGAGFLGPFAALDGLVQARYALAQLLNTIPGSIANGLVLFFLLFLLRLVLRKEWLAAAAFVLLLAGFSSLTASHPAIAFPFGVVSFALMALALVRFGLLSAVFGFVISDILLLFPLTLDPGSWYWGLSLFAILAVMAIGAFAMNLALAGRKVFSGDLLRD